MKYARNITAYHGCDRLVAEKLLAGDPFESSDKPYDWLGRGVYFWEYGADRAFRWAEKRVSEGTINEPAVVGAVVQLGACLDLMDTRNTHAIRDAYPAWRDLMMQQKVPLPKNDGRDPDKKSRKLDCAVLNWFLDRAERGREPFQTVRCGFTEGPPIFDDSFLMLETHIQLCVRDTTCIVGVFRPSSWHE